VVEQFHLSERRACRLGGLSRDSYRNPPVVDELTASLNGAIIDVAHARRRFGYRRIHGLPLQVAGCVNEVWSMDFVSDSLVNGHRFKCLPVADDFSHECVEITADFGIGGQYVTRLLDQAAIFRCYPKAVRTDNGPEFTSRAFIGWAQTHGIRHLLIEPGKPMQSHRTSGA
jgi:putative transposase